MGNADMSGSEGMAGLEKRILSELETLREITQILDRNWKDRAADLVKKELDYTILLLDERTAVIRKTISEPDKKQQEETQHG